MSQSSIERLRDYLGQLPPKAQALLMREFERAIERGEDVAVANFVLEQLRMIVVARDPWSIENGCLTPTMKIKRNRIEAAVGDKVEKWYGAKGPVVWA